MKTLHLLLVGINDYHQAAPLKKAISDVEALERWVRKNSEYQLNIQKLLNVKATRQNIIAAFEKMARQAKSGDTCLFYFSGHGSNVEPPRELYTRSEGNFESILCYDSRRSAYDLTDKELSYLIWKVTDGKKIHFVAMMDCCYSGDSTRDPKDRGINKTAEPNHSAQPAENYYGYQQYRRGTYPPQGPHILLSACQPEESAFDGFFTAALLTALQGHCSYEELMDEVLKKMDGEDDPTPSLYEVDCDYKHKEFLNGAVSF